MGTPTTAWLTLASLVLGAAVTLPGAIDDSVSGEAAFEVWADVLRDVDQLGLTLSRMPADEEMALGRRLLGECGVPDSPLPRQAYVAAVGQALLPHVRRRDIRYQFHVVPWEVANAFALPGGQVVITEGMLDDLRSEAELAAILSHEIAHVDQYHCVERFQSQAALARIGLGDLAVPAELLRRVWAVGYRRYQEAEADTVGLRIATEAGYDPHAAVRLMRRLVEEEPAGAMPAPPPRTPLGEAAGAMVRSLGDYLASHPDAEQRADRLEAIIRSREAWWGRRPAYVGAENYRLGVCRDAREFPGELTGGP